MADGRMLRRKIAWNKQIPVGCTLLDQRFGFGHGGYGGMLVTWLIAFQDCEGRVRVDAAWLKSEVVPLITGIDPTMVDAYISAFAKVGAFLYYETEGRRWIQFEGFSRCNRVNKTREANPAPAPAPDMLLVVPPPNVHALQLELQSKSGSTPAQSLSLSLSLNSLPPIGAREGSPSSDSPSAPLVSDSGPDASPAAPGSREPSPPLPVVLLSPDAGPPSPANASETPPRPRRKGPPLPFTVAEAVQALCAPSPGRFALEPFEEKFAAPVVALIREYSSLDDWRLVGAAFAAGLESWRAGPVNIRMLVKAGNFSLWLRAAREWAVGGRKSLTSPAKRTAATGVRSNADRRRAMAESFRD